MLRYIFLSVFVLLLLTACGSNDFDKFKQSGFKECRECDLSGAYLQGADLTGADLFRADLYEANLTGANLAGANLTDAILDGAFLTNANLTNANLTGANLTGADLTGANLTRARLYAANLTDANLTDADLTEANLYWAHFNGAKLRGVINADFTGAYNNSDKYEEGLDVQTQGLKLFLVIFISLGLWVFLTVICNTRTSSEARLTRSGLTSYTANLGWKEYILVFVGCFAFVAGYCYWPEISSLIGL